LSQNYVLLLYVGRVVFGVNNVLYSDDTFYL
jgi:hypothetical protein